MFRFLVQLFLQQIRQTTPFLLILKMSKKYMYKYRCIIHLTLWPKYWNTSASKLLSVLLFDVAVFIFPTLLADFKEQYKIGTDLHIAYVPSILLLNLFYIKNLDTFSFSSISLTLSSMVELISFICFSVLSLANSALALSARSCFSS